MALMWKEQLQTKVYTRRVGIYLYNELRKFISRTIIIFHSWMKNLYAIICWIKLENQILWVENRSNFQQKKSMKYQCHPSGHDFQGELWTSSVLFCIKNCSHFYRENMIGNQLKLTVFVNLNWLLKRVYEMWAIIMAMSRDASLGWDNRHGMTLKVLH